MVVIEINRQLAEAGAHVVMAVRNTKAAHDLIQQWQRDWSAKGLPLNIEVINLDYYSIGRSQNMCLLTRF